MGIKNRIALFVCVGLLSTTALAGSGWVDVAASGSDTFSIKTDSFRITTTDGGKQAARVIGRDVDSSTTQVSVEIWYVTTPECDNGYGNLVTLDIDGNFKYENPFADGAGSVASSIAKVICGVYEQKKRDAAQKSI
jgi:hypothetical protein